APLNLLTVRLPRPQVINHQEVHRRQVTDNPFLRHRPLLVVIPLPNLHDQPPEVSDVRRPAIDYRRLSDEGRQLRLTLPRRPIQQQPLPISSDIRQALSPTAPSDPPERLHHLKVSEALIQVTLRYARPHHLRPQSGYASLVL